MRHFLQLSDHSRAELDALLERAQLHCEARKRGDRMHTLAGVTLVCIFEKASTRTRVSFEAAVMQLGGHAITIDQAGSQLGRGEPIEDTARVLSRYGDVLMFRTFGDDRLNAFAQASSVPVINGLSEGGHPVQVLADLLTARQEFGDFSAKKTVFLGDCASNMALSWVQAARIWGFPLTLGCPATYAPPAAALTGAQVRVEHDAKLALHDASIVNTDVWTSMGQELEGQRRLRDLAEYTLSPALLECARAEAIVLHCLPAHRGEEIAASVLDGARARVWQQAENRLHVQKAILEWCVDRLPARSQLF